MFEPISGRGATRPVASYRPPAPGQNQDLRQLLAEWPLASDGRFGCYLIAGTSPYSNLGRGIECCVFEQFFGNDPAVMSAEYGAYEAQSSFFLVVDRELQQPAGALRVITNSAEGLKTLNDIAREPLSIPRDVVTEHHRIDDLDTCWDIGTVAVLKQYRGTASGHLISTMLYGLLRAEACRMGIQHAVTVLDAHVFSQLTTVLGIPFIPIADSEPFAYLGSSSSIASYVSARQVGPSIEAHMRRMESEVLKLVRPLLERVADESKLPPLVSVT